MQVVQSSQELSDDYGDVFLTENARFHLKKTFNDTEFHIVAMRRTRSEQEPPEQYLADGGGLGSIATDWRRAPTP